MINDTANPIEMQEKKLNELSSKRMQKKKQEKTQENTRKHKKTYHSYHG